MALIDHEGLHHGGGAQWPEYHSLSCPDDGQTKRRGNGANPWLRVCIEGAITTAVDKDDPWTRPQTIGRKLAIARRQGHSSAAALCLLLGQAQRSHQ